MRYSWPGVLKSKYKGATMASINHKRRGKTSVFEVLTPPLLSISNVGPPLNTASEISLWLVPWHYGVVRIQLRLCAWLAQSDPIPGMHSTVAIVLSLAFQRFQLGRGPTLKTTDLPRPRGLTKMKIQSQTGVSPWIFLGLSSSTEKAKTASSPPQRGSLT